MSVDLEFKASKLDITPRDGARLSGFMSRKTRVTEIHSTLELNAQFFISGQSSWAVISVDTLFISSALKQLILDAIKVVFPNVTEENCWIAASHTHYAPSLEEDRVDLGEIDQDYLDFLSEQIPPFFKHLSEQKSEEVTLSLGSVKTDKIIVNRRRFARFLKKYFSPEIMMEEEIKREKDEQLHLIKIIRNSDKKVLGSIWNFACHPTNLPNHETISSEFPGVMRKFVRELSNDEHLPTVFLQGFAGDIRAFANVQSFRKSVYKFLQLSYPINFYKFDQQKQFDDWCTLFSDHVKNAWNQASEIEKSGSISIHYLNENIQDTLGISTKGTDSIIFRKVSFDQLSFVSISAEVVSAYGHHVRSIFEDKNAIPVGYVDPVFGYLPTAKQIQEGGYESQGYFKPFLIEGEFMNNVEEQVVECLKKLK